MQVEVFKADATGCLCLKVKNPR